MSVKELFYKLFVPKPIHSNMLARGFSSRTSLVCSIAFSTMVYSLLGFGVCKMRNLAAKPACCDVDVRIDKFRNSLLKVQPKLQNGIITVAGKNYDFSVSSNAVTQNSQYYIGSVSKQMTAYMVLETLKQKYPDKSLEYLLHQKIVDIFPDSKILKKVGALWKGQVTLLDLLTHRSGLPDWVSIYENEYQKPEALNKPIDPKALLTAGKWDSTKSYLYSNTNYFLLGKLIEEILDTSYEEAFDQIIKRPAKMSDSYAPKQGNYFILKHSSKFKDLQKDLNDKIFIDFANVGGAGGVISTNKDLLKWNHYLYHQTNIKIRNAMLKNYYVDEDGDQVHLGLTTTITKIGDAIGFQGGIDSYRSFLVYFPAHNLGVSILSNNNDDFDQLLSCFIETLID